MNPVLEDRQISDWLLRARKEERLQRALFLASGVLLTCVVGVLSSVSVAWLN